MYNRYVCDWFGHTKEGSHKPCTRIELKQAKEALWDEIERNAALMTAHADTPQNFSEILETPLYSTIPETVHCSKLLNPAKIFASDAYDAGSDANRCTVYALNCLLGGAYWTNLDQYFKCVAAGSKIQVTKLHADFAA